MRQADQNRLQTAEIGIEQIRAKLAGLEQVVDLLTARVESMVVEDEVRVKDPAHGTAVRRGAVRSNHKQAAKASV